jgi:TraM recognition site of TraD and TraG
VRAGRHYLIIDECQLFLAQSEETLQALLSETRKYGLFLVMAHQNYSQTSERLWGALQNAGIEVALKEGRDDAEHSARILGQVDTTRIKHEVADADRAERMHPVFDPIAEQRENFIQELTDLHRGHAYVRLPEWKRRIPFVGRRHDHTLHLRTWHVPYPAINLGERSAVEEEFLKRFFSHRSELARQSVSAEEPRIARSGMRNGDARTLPVENIV